MRLLCWEASVPTAGTALRQAVHTMVRAWARHCHWVGKGLQAEYARWEAISRNLTDRSGSGLVNQIVSGLALLLAVGPVYAVDLCKANSFTKSQAEQGKPEYNSSCGLCHLYNLKGRVPGEYQDETPDFRILNEKYMKTLDDNGGGTPPLVGQAFLSKWQDQKAFVDRISTAILGFPPKNYVKFDSDVRIAAYILYRNCGELGERSGHH